MDETIINLIDETANMLRGMILDPSIPKHAKDALNCRIELLESAVNTYLTCESSIVLLNDGMTGNKNT